MIQNTPLTSFFVTFLICYSIRDERLGLMAEPKHLNRKKYILITAQVQANFGENAVIFCGFSFMTNFPSLPFTINKKKTVVL